MAEKSIDRELFLFDEVAYLNPSSCEPLIRIDSEIQREGGTGGGEESGEEISDWVMRCVKFFNKFLAVSIEVLQEQAMKIFAAIESRRNLQYLKASLEC